MEDLVKFVQKKKEKEIQKFIKNGMKHTNIRVEWKEKLIHKKLKKNGLRIVQVQEILHGVEEHLLFHIVLNLIKN